MVQQAVDFCWDGTKSDREPAPETSDSEAELSGPGCVGKSRNKAVKTITGDFTGKQFTKKRVAKKVKEQYGEEHARVFYQHVMGGGGLDIHYGIFRKPTDGVYEASKATNKFLKQQLDWMNPMEDGAEILDLGSGTGGLSHEMALEFPGSKVVSFNLCPKQNEMNKRAAEKLGLGDDQLEIVEGNFNEGLPAEWTNRFTHIVSCEVFCHAADKTLLLKELMRVLKPSGALVFTDIMGADGADEKALKDFTDRNATTAMARPSEYYELLRECGFENTSFWDGSCHLVHYFRAMLRVCLSERKAMLQKGVPAGYLDNWERSLTERCQIQNDAGVFAWGVMSARKSGDVVSQKHVVVIPRLEELEKVDVMQSFEERFSGMKGVAGHVIAGRICDVPPEFLAKAEILFTSWGHAPDALNDFEALMPKLRWVHLLTVGMSPTIQTALLRAKEQPTCAKGVKVTSGSSNHESSGGAMSSCIFSNKGKGKDAEMVKKDPLLVTTGKGSFSNAIAEYVLASVLHFKKNLTQILSCQQEKVWKHPISNVVEVGNGNLTIGLVGYGSIGKTIGKLFSAMGARILYTNSEKVDTTGSNRTAGSNGKTNTSVAPNKLLTPTALRSEFISPYSTHGSCPVQVSQKQLFAEADVIVSTLPETPATHHLFDEDAFSSMKQNCVFVNVGRGSVVDEDALVKHSGKFAGIVLDVFQTEPLPKTSPFWNLDNVLLTPHCLVFSDRFSSNVMDTFQNLLAEYLNGIAEKKGTTSLFSEALFQPEKGY